MNVITRKRGLAGLALVGAASFILAGCAAAPETNDTADSVDFTGCAVSDEGSWNDKSFNEAAYGGLTKAKDDLGIKTNDAESNSEEDFEPNLAQMVDANCDVIFAVGFNLIDPVNAAAEANPDSHFVTIDGYANDPATTNLKPVQYAMDQSSYLAGYLAAAYSTTKVLGTYGGLDIEAVTVFMDGFYYGAKAYEEETGTPVTVLGWNEDKVGQFTDGFGDAAGAKSISQGFISQDADVIYPVAGGLFSATSEAINESGTDIVFIGVDKDIAVTSPEYADQVLTSVEKKMTDAVYDIIAELVDGEEFDATPYVGTLENGGTQLSSFGTFDDKIDQEIKDKLDELTADIISGAIVPIP